MCRICGREVNNEHRHIEKHLNNGDIPSRISLLGWEALDGQRRADLIEAMVCDYIFVG